MRAIGNVQSGQFHQLFPDLPTQAVSVIGVDYINIVWWTEAMVKTGVKLQAILQFLSQPGNSHADPKFLKLKHDLADQLANLAGRTRQDFGGPWGLLAMSLVAPRTGRRFLLFNSNVSLMCETQGLIWNTILVERSQAMEPSGKPNPTDGGPSSELRMDMMRSIVTEPLLSKVRRAVEPGHVAGVRGDYRAERTVPRWH